MKVFVGADHGGFDLKNEILDILDSLDVEYEDFSSSFDKDDDYPDVVKPVCENVINKNSCGILVCGTGIGMSITANRFKGIRAALCRSVEDAVMSRHHNDSNVLCLGGRVKNEDVKDIVEGWLNAKFDGGRHKRRLDKLRDLGGC